MKLLSMVILNSLRYRKAEDVRKRAEAIPSSVDLIQILQ
jgi:hypothetical protein